MTVLTDDEQHGEAELGEAEAPVVEAPEQEEVSEPEALIVQIGDEEPEEDDGAKAPEWVRDLRKSDRDKAKRIRELEARLEQSSVATVPTLGEKPTFEGCDFDQVEFERQLEAWHDNKRAHDDAERQRATAQKAADERWQAKLERYQTGRTTIQAPDYSDAEEAAIEILSQAPPFEGLGNVPDIRINILKNAAPDPNLLIYALGKHPKKAKELAAITDASEYAFALGAMSATMKVTSKPATAPEKRITGTGGASLAASTDGTLDRLRTEAAKTGDYSKVLEYKRSKRG